MKTADALELIKKEREDQVEKHGFTEEHDDQNNKSGQLQDAADSIVHQKRSMWPRGWLQSFLNNILTKSRCSQLVAAGALYLAEKQRLERKLSRSTSVDNSKLRGMISALDGLINSLCTEIVNADDNE